MANARIERFARNFRAGVRGWRSPFDRLGSTWRSVRRHEVTIACTAIALFVGLHIIATLVVREQVAIKPRTTGPMTMPDLAFDGKTRVLTDITKSGIDVRRADSGPAFRRLPPNTAVEGRLRAMSNSVAVVQRRDGALIAYRLGARDKVIGDVGSTFSRAQTSLWAPISGFASAIILPMMAQIDPLSVPEEGRPIRRGSIRDCATCADLVDIDGGWAFVGAMLWQRWRTGGDPRVLLYFDRFAIGRRTVSKTQVEDCMAGMSCVGDMKNVKNGGDVALPFIAWMNEQANKAVYRLPSLKELDLIARSPGLGVMASGGDELGCDYAFNDDQYAGCKAFAVRRADGSIDRNPTKADIGRAGFRVARGRHMD